MRVSRRMKRMARRDRKGVSLSLTSLMDVFTNLVFFLLLSQGVTNVDEPPKGVKLPDSYVDTKPKPSVNILLSEQQGIVVQGELTASYDDALGEAQIIEPLKVKLAQIRANEMNLDAESKEGNSEVTIVAHSTVPFKVMKKLMTTCTSAGYTTIALAVNQKSDVPAP